MEAGHGKGPCDNKREGGQDNNTQLEVLPGSPL